VAASESSSEQWNPKTVALAETLLANNLAFQRAVGSLVLCKRMYSIVHDELLRLLNELPPGLPDSVPMALTEELQRELAAFFVASSTAQQSAAVEPAEVVSACGSFTLPWLYDIVRERAREAARLKSVEQQKAKAAKKDATIRLPFTIFPEADKRNQHKWTKPLVFVADESFRSWFPGWLLRGLKAENGDKKFLLLRYAAAGRSLDELATYVDDWHHKIGREASTNSEVSLLTRNVSIQDGAPDVLFAADLLDCVVPADDMSSAVLADRALRGLQNSAAVWQAATVACLFLDKHHDEASWRALRWNSLKTSNTVLHVTGDRGTVYIGRYSGPLRGDA
jgi:hypothetical protein